MSYGFLEAMHDSFPCAWLHSAALSHPLMSAWPASWLMVKRREDMLWKKVSASYTAGYTHAWREGGSVLISHSLSHLSAISAYTAQTIGNLSGESLRTFIQKINKQTKAVVLTSQLKPAHSPACLCVDARIYTSYCIPLADSMSSSFLYLHPGLFLIFVVTSLRN
jgi:hypothetical protein